MEKEQLKISDLVILVRTLCIHLDFYEVFHQLQANYPLFECFQDIHYYLRVAVSTWPEMKPSHSFITKSIIQSWFLKEYIPPEGNRLSWTAPSVQESFKKHNIRWYCVNCIQSWCEIMAFYLDFLDEIQGLYNSFLLCSDGASIMVL